jgi:hypothetical protein
MAVMIDDEWADIGFLRLVIRFLCSVNTITTAVMPFFIAMNVDYGRQVGDE